MRDGFGACACVCRSSPGSILDEELLLPAMPASTTRLLVVVLLLAGCASSRPVRDTVGGREVLFRDEFSGPVLDRGSWNVEGPRFWVNNEQQAYVDSAATIGFEPRPGAEDGALILRPVFRPGFETPTGRVADFLSGRIDSRGKVERGHGRYEARIRMTDHAGVWPAWWLLGAGRWPDTGEIDIMEYVGERDWTAVALHGPGYSGDTPLVNRQYFPPGEDVTGWHVYAVEWAADGLEFFVDDRLAYRATREMVEHYGPWRFDEPKYLILNFALGGAYPFKTNGVRSPYNGLPASTVDAIKAGQVEMAVDWVRVLAPRPDGR